MGFIKKDAAFFFCFHPHRLIDCKKKMEGGGRGESMAGALKGRVKNATGCQDFWMLAK